jgi:hypothetical protein
VRVDAGLLGRRLLLQREQRRPDARVEVHGECNTNTYTYTYSNAEANSNTQGAPDSISSPDSASLKEMAIGGPSTPISLLYTVQSSLSLRTDKSGESSGLDRSTASQDRNGAGAPPPVFIRLCVASSPKRPATNVSLTNVSQMSFAIRSKPNTHCAL